MMRYTGAVGKDYGLRFFDVRIIKIVEDMISSKVFTTSFRVTNVSQIRVGKMMSKLQSMLNVLVKHVKNDTTAGLSASRTLMPQASTTRFRTAGSWRFSLLMRSPRMTTSLVISRQTGLIETTERSITSIIFPTQSEAKRRFRALRSLLRSYSNWKYCLTGLNICSSVLFVVSTTMQ